MTNTAVAEIFTFRLSPDTDARAFTEAAAALTPFLTGTGAFLSRTLSADETGLWTDHVTWTSLAAAKRAAKLLADRPEAQPFMAMIAPEGLAMRHAVIHLSLDREAHATD
jgi:hypothetical protein